MEMAPTVIGRSRAEASWKSGETTPLDIERSPARQQGARIQRLCQIAARPARRPGLSIGHDRQVKAVGGSLSAEHGIGTLKAAELARLGNPAKLAAMRAIKSALDPEGIMNPAKLFA